jgi:hypothetical protein
VVLLLNAFIAYENNVEMIYWFREYSLLSLLLLYFPFREHIKTEGDMKRLMLCFAFTVIILSGYQFWLYYTGMTTQSVDYAYQIGRSIRINQPILTSAAFFGFVFTLHIRKLLPKLIMLVFTIMSITALVVTFSRTFWIILLFGIVVIFFYANPKQRITLITSSIISIVVFTAVVFMFFEDNAGIAINYIEKRFSSASEGLEDISVQSRLAEYEVVLKKISDYPLGGNGLGRTFHFFNPIPVSTTRTGVIHNGYLYLSYRIGIPLTLCFLVVIIYYFIRLERYSRIISDSFYRTLALGGFVSMLLIFISNITSPQFQSRDGVFIILFSFVIVTLCEQKYLAERNDSGGRENGAK